MLELATHEILATLAGRRLTALQIEARGKCAALPGQDQVSRLGGPVVRGHPDHPGIQPVDRTDPAVRGEATVARDHHVDRPRDGLQGLQFRGEISLRRRRPEKAGDIRDPAMDDDRAPKPDPAKDAEDRDTE